MISSGPWLIGSLCELIMWEWWKNWAFEVFAGPNPRQKHVTSSQQSVIGSLDLVGSHRQLSYLSNQIRSHKGVHPLPKIIRTLCQLSGVPTCFQVYRHCLYVAHQNTHINGANFSRKFHRSLSVLDPWMFR